MAEGQEKTEQATPRRREEARKKGQVAKSPELSGAVALLVTILTLRSALGNSGLLEYLHFSLSTLHLHMADPSEISRTTREALMVIVRAVGLPIAVGLGAGIAVSVGQVGFLFTARPIMPDVNKVNPMTGLQRLLGTRGIVEAVKAILKVSIVGIVVYITLRTYLPNLLTLIMLPPQLLLPALGSVIYTLAIRVVVVFLLLAAFDYLYQRWELEKSLRMSKEEIKQELKSSDGDPMIKAMIRQRQREVSKRRMMDSVPNADVIITNPTHFAVALAYNGESMAAPKVLAKGKDVLAARIREIARENNIPIVENPPLARALYKEVEIDKEIPGALYAAVAEVLAVVFERDRKRGGRRAGVGA